MYYFLVREIVMLGVELLLRLDFRFSLFGDGGEVVVWVVVFLDFCICRFFGLFSSSNGDLLYIGVVYINTYGI